jgi:hypothetical protein
LDGPAPVLENKPATEAAAAEVVAAIFFFFNDTTRGLFFFFFLSHAQYVRSIIGGNLFYT